MRLKTAPSASATTAGGGADGLVGVGGAEVDRPGRGLVVAVAVRERAHAADDLLAVDEHGGVAEPVARHVAVLVAEDRRVERLGPLEVAAHELTPGKRAGRVGELDAGVLAAL